MAQQRIARIITRLDARAAETLARRPAQQYVEFAGIQPDALDHGIGSELANVSRRARSSGEIAAVGFYRVSINVGGKSNVITCLAETERTPARAGEQADGRRPERNYGNGVIRLVNHNVRCFIQSYAFT
jgi:hypothetical protein